MSRRSFSGLLSLSLFLCGGCATTGEPRPLSPREPPAWGAAPEREGSAAAADRPGRPGGGGQLPVSGELRRLDSREIPGGLACLIRLREAGIAHRHLKRLRGVDTPVVVTGPIGGIVYRPMGRTPLVADCRLVLALLRAAPYLRNLGVTEMDFSGAYSFRTMPGGRLSRHAMGLAIDVHRVVAGGKRLVVAEDYEMGFEDGGGCALNAATLNRISCVLLERGLFDRVLTPDFDRAHYNHFHLAILSLHRRRHSRGTPRPVAD